MVSTTTSNLSRIADNIKSRTSGNTSSNSGATGTASGAHDTALSSGIANHTTKTNGQANTAKSTTSTNSTTSTSSTSSTSSTTPIKAVVNQPLQVQSGSGGSSLSNSTKTSTVTVQPTYISGGKGGNTYIITRADGTQNQIAASGISMEDAAKYYAERGNTKAASDFAAAANYEAETKIKETYGTKTGITYDATASIVLNNSGTGVNVADTAVSYVAGNGLTGSSPAETLRSKTVTTSLGLTADELKNVESNGLSVSSGTITDARGNTSQVTLFTNPTGIDTPEEYINAVGGMENIGKGITIGSGSNSGFMQAGSDLVDGFAHLPETLASDGSIVGLGAGLAATMLLPTDLVKVGKNIADGNADENTIWDYLYAGADLLSFIPVVGLGFKAVKTVAKAAKGAGWLSGGLTLGTSVVETTLDPGDGDNDKAVKNAKLLVDAVDTGDGSKLTWMNPSGAWVSEIDNPTKADTPTQNPQKEQTLPTHQPEQNTEYDLSGLSNLLTNFAGAGNGQAGESGGGSSGDVTVVTNEAQPVDYSGVFKYIIPGLIIIGIIIIIAASMRNKPAGKVNHA